MLGIVIYIRTRSTYITAIRADSDRLSLMRESNGIDKMQKNVGMKLLSLNMKAYLLPL